MKDGIALPGADWDMHSPDAIRRITGWMESTGIQMFELSSSQGDRLRISLAGSTRIEPMPVPREPARTSDEDDRLIVTSPYFGVFSPSAEVIEALCAPSSPHIPAGTVIAQLELGYLTIPIETPQDGEGIAFLAQTGEVIGYGAPVLAMRRPASPAPSASMSGSSRNHGRAP